MEIKTVLRFIIMFAVLSAHGYLHAQDKGETMEILTMKPLTETGSSKEVDILFKGPKRTIVQITLRNNGVLASHKAAEPITIQCISGKGTLKVGADLEKIVLTPNILVTIEPNIIHEIVGEPAVSILLTKFMQE